MSGLAWILHERGIKVTGSDRESSSITERLKNAGIPVTIGHAPENVGNADIVVATSAVTRENPELIEAHNRHIELVWRADLLGRILSEYETRIAIAGTHGKTTTTALTAIVLIEAGLDPTVLLGGDWNYISGNARIGKSDVILTEACEAFDSYLYLKPNIAVVTNIEPDHLDYHKNFEGVVRSFDKFLAGVDKEGAVIACEDCPTARKLLKEWPLLPKTLLGYGFSSQASIRAVEVLTSGMTSSATVLFNGQRLGRLKLNVPGEKNLLNALAAVGVGTILGVPFETIANALAKFRGVDRRFQILGEVRGITVVDDYAHHPTELRATIEAARNVAIDGRIIAVFQPHLYSRTQSFLTDFAQSFDEADRVVVTDVYAAREFPIPGAGAEDIVNLINESNPGKAVFVKDRTEIPEMLAGELKEGDIVLILGAGNIWEEGWKLLEILREGAS